MAGGTQRQTASAGHGVLFEVIFKNANPRKQPSHGISLSYGGQVYSCNDAASVRSVHTIHTDDEDEDESSKSRCQSKSHGRSSLQEASSSPACLKKAPRNSALQPTSLLKPSPKKLKRSQTLSPSHQSRARSILTPFSNFSRKLSVRRHSYDERTKTERDKSQTRQEKAEKIKPLLCERPVVQGLPQTFQQAPQQFTYQHSLPVYHYMPVSQPQPVFGRAPMAFPKAQGAANSAHQTPPELQHLQEHIDHLTMILAANPVDLHAKRELHRLLADRNAFLDSATSSATKRPAPTTTSRHIGTSNHKVAEIRSVAEKTVAIDSMPTDESHKKASVSIVSSDARGASNLHICSGCGEVRSASFHGKHLFSKAVHNICRKCREGKRVSSVIGRYHFCGSCGIVRSKEYHRRHRTATVDSTRSKICRKCQATGNSVYRSTKEACREHRAPAKDRRHKSVDPTSIPCDTPQKSHFGAEPRARPVHPHRQCVSANEAEMLGYDGVPDLTSSNRTVNGYPSVKQKAFTTYRSPEISEDTSSNQPASMESSFHSSDPESLVKAGNAAEPSSPQISAHISASEESLHTAQQDTAPFNPYYQPRNNTGRLSSPFHFEETFHARPSPAAERAPSQDSVRTQDQYSASCSLEDPQRPRFVDRNQSWPGDLNLPSPGFAFSQFPHPARKASASDGAPSPTTGDYLHPFHDFDSGQRFTNGAFGKIPSSSSAFRPRSSSPVASAWASFSGPIPNPSSEPGSGGGGSRGAFSSANRESAFGRRYDTRSEPTSPADSPSFSFRFGDQSTSYANRDDGRATCGGFASTRGAWNVNSASTSTFAARHGDHDHVPEPIIEEPSSPVLKSPLTTPLLLEFNLADSMSDSGVEFLTDPSSSSVSSSGDESLLASRLDNLSIQDH